MTDHTVGSARRLAGDLLVAAGLRAAEAERTATILVLTDVWGIQSHGLMRLPFYLQRLAAGGIRADASLTTSTDTGPLVAMDGHDGLGHWQLWTAAETAAQRCRQYGIAAVSVADSSHCGALGAYVLPMLAADQIGIAFSNGPAVMPPWGGTAPVLSTSPIAAGIPSRPRPAIVDLATSAVARGRIKAAAQRDEPLQPGWAVDAHGRPTVDATAALAGMLAPLGGVKGYALAFLVEALTGGLVGPSLSVDVPDMFDPAQDARPQRISHLVLALDPNRFDPDAVHRFTALAERTDAAGGRVPGSRRPGPDELDDKAPLELATPIRDQLSQWADGLDVTPR